MRLTPVALAGLLAGCAPQAEAPAPAIVFDCAQSFADQVARITTARGMTRAPVAREPYRYYNAADGATSFVITDPQAPAHPAIIRQRALGGGMETTGCAYGHKGAYDELLAYVASLGRNRP
jgi:hypothetical protein